MKHLFYALSVLGFAVTAHAQSYNPGLPLPGLPKSLGQKPMAGSTSVTIASDQTPITVTATNPSIGTNYSVAPGSSTEVGYIDQNGNLHPFLGDSVGITVTAKPVSASSNTISRIANGLASATLLSSNANRKGIFLYNDSTNTNCYVKFGATASLTSFTIKMFATDTYIMDPPVYTGVIDFICDVASGSMEVNEQ